MSRPGRNVVVSEGAMDEENRKSEGLEVWMDGACPICRRSQRWCEDRDPNRNIRFIDFRSSANRDLPVQRDQHETSMWAQDENGTLFEGFAAWRRILAEIPRWRWLAFLATIPPASWVGPSLYRLVAKLRFGLSSI